MAGHCYALTGELLAIDIAHIAVDVFFVISGFLVTGSLLTSKNMLVFCKSRLLRIFPGLIVVLLLTVFFLGPVFTRLPVQDYFNHQATWRYFFTNALLYDMQPGLPGVFETQTYPDMINGSLWTLAYELKMYLVLALAGFLAYGGSRWLPEMGLKFLISLLAIVATPLLLAVYSVAGPKVDTPLINTLRFSSLFFIGSAFYVWREKVRLNSAVALLMVLIIILLKLKFISIPGIKSVRAFQASYNIFLGYIVLCFCYFPSRFLQGFNRFGDYSYGLYIYAFPVQQAVLALLGEMAPWMLFLFAFPLVLLLSVLSWHGIEKPFLRLKAHMA